MALARTTVLPPWLTEIDRSCSSGWVMSTLMSTSSSGGDLVKNPGGTYIEFVADASGIPSGIEIGVSSGRSIPPHWDADAVAGSTSTTAAIAMISRKLRLSPDTLG